LAVVPIVVGEQEDVPIQYLVVLVSFGVSVTEKSELLRVLFALSVVVGAIVSRIIFLVVSEVVLFHPSRNLI
jgi:uncharacterized membrane protein YciS (DUF1049 family)